MSHLFRSLAVKCLVLCMLILLVPLASCGGSSQTTLTVGGKLDPEAQLLTKMYVLLLQKAGFNVIEKSKLGTNAIVFNALKSGQIDLYPEFTGTGLFQLGITTPPGTADQVYQTVKSGYENKFKITWLKKAPLNNTYGICTLKTPPSQLAKVKNISDLKPIASQLTVATPPDGLTDPSSLPGLKKTYGITFGHVMPPVSEIETFQVVQKGQAQVNVCYTTRPEIGNTFVLLNDDKNVAAPDNPAPIVRDESLKKAPGIKDALDPLAPKLTSDVSRMLQLQVANGQSVTVVATNFLKSQGLL